jgi:predicted protein tyrosine phosphatase
MINSIVITNLADAVSASFKEGKENAWISAVDEADRNKIRIIQKNFSKQKKSHFVQYFHDWSDEDDDVYIQRHLDELGPREQHVNSIISFLQPIVESNKVYHLGVNCYAGVSRSTAIGIIAWVIQGKSPQEALDEIIKIRPTAWPNLRILRFASERLEIDLVNPVKEWKQLNNNGIYTGGW